jgi:LmbE family N-acetylglucosaminyl deacetylase
VLEEEHRLRRLANTQRVVGGVVFMVVAVTVLWWLALPDFRTWSDQGRPMSGGVAGLLAIEIVGTLFVAAFLGWAAMFAIQYTIDRKYVAPVRTERHRTVREMTARSTARVPPEVHPAPHDLLDHVHLRHRRALVVVAHPDDETFGLGAVVDLLTSNGIHVDQLCFTRGEASSLGASPDLADRRAVELRAACTTLGIHRLNQLPYPDGHLAEVSREELANYVEAMLDGSEVLVVFEEGGITGHPDHRAATAAAMLAAGRRGLALLEWGMSPEVAATLRDEFGLPFSEVGGDGCVDLTVDRTRQHAAITCHASQSADNPVLRRRLELQGNSERLRYTPGKDF